MKTLKELTQARPELAAIIRKIHKEMGPDGIRDAANNGIENGFNGFTYHRETHEFAIKHQKQILPFLDELAEMSGGNSLDVLKEYQPIGDIFQDGDNLMDLYLYLGGGKPREPIATNHIAWFVVQNVCNWFMTD